MNKEYLLGAMSGCVGIGAAWLFSQLAGNTTPNFWAIQGGYFAIIFGAYLGVVINEIRNKKQ